MGSLSYYFKPKYYCDHLKQIEESLIEEAKLVIDIQEGRTIVTLSEMKTNTTFNGDPMPPFTLVGNLYLFENTDIAYSLIFDDRGRCAMPYIR